MDIDNFQHFIQFNFLKLYYDLVDSLTKENSQEIFTQKQQNPTISREPSFLYDTTVEAFSTKGTTIDEGEELSDEGISIIGQITDLVENEDEVDKFIEENTPSKETIVEKFEIQERESISDSHLENEDNDKDPAIIVNEDSLEGAMSIPKAGTHRRLSNISVEEASKISSTPEGENYFMKREESFITKVHKGEVENLAVEISDYFSLEHSASHSSLSVKPFDVDPESEIIVDNLGSQSNLVVKPVETTIKSIPCSSYEHLYDRVEAEPEDDVQMSAADILENLGDKFVGTHDIPEFYSSFEELYKKENTESPSSKRKSKSVEKRQSEERK